MSDQQKILSAELYDLSMRLTDEGVAHVDWLIERFCVLAGIPYPPQHH